MAQEPDTRTELWPEINAYINLHPKLRMILLGTVSSSVEDGELLKSDAFEAQLGVSVDYIPSNHVILRTGYRFGTSVGDSEPFKEHRLITEQTFRHLFKGNILVSDRNREDFRWVNGDFSFRYRNRLTIEREFPFFMGRSFIPYVSGEIYFDTRYDTWNRNRYGFGVQFPLKERKGPLKLLFPKRDLVFDIYYLRQNDSRASTAHVNAIGLVLAVYF